jgi:predicted nuclease of predicted toxin-antitoxin system
MQVFRRHEQCVLFVDDCFGHKQLVDALRKEGFIVVAFEDKFDKRQNVKDTEIIPYCSENTLLIATTDKDMVLRHRDLLNERRQCVIFTTNANDDSMKVWLPAFVENKAKILRTWKKREPPWIGRLHPGRHLEIFDLMRYTKYDAETEERRKHK